MLKTIINNFHLEKLIWIIKTKLKYMILIGIIFGALAGGFAFITRSDLYAATISFYVYSNPDYINDNGINLSTGEINQASALLNSYSQILKSDGFLKSVIEEAELNPMYYTVSRLRSYVSTQAVGGTAVFKVTVRDPDPYMAMTIANTIGALAPEKIVSIVKSGGIEILDEAVLPTTPYKSTSIFMMIALGVAAGGVLSALFFIYKGLMNTTYRRTYEVEDMFNILSAAGAEQRREMMSFDPHRADVIAAGGIILRAALGAFDFSEFYVSTKGVRHGVACSL